MADENQQPTEQPAITPAVAPKTETDQPEVMIPKSRFDEINRKAKDAEKRLAEIEAASKEAETNKLAETQQFQKLYESEQKKAAKLEQRLNDMVAADRKRTVTTAIEAEARKAGFAEPSDAYLFVDVDGIEVDDTGKVKGIEPLVKELAKNKPYLLAATNPAKGNGQNPAPSGLAGTAAKTEEARKQWERTVRSW